MSVHTVAWVFAGLCLAVPLLVLFNVGLNLCVWPRTCRRAHPEIASRVSILIPARNEAHTIEACVRAALGQVPAPFEVVVYDDDSSDGTSEILASLAQETPLLRVVRGTSVPSGWVGKPHACHRLSVAARGDTFLFVDADTVLRQGGLTRLLDLRRAFGAHLLTAVPRQYMVSWSERWMIPLLHLTYVAWLPLPLIWRTRDPRFIAANGQLMCVDRETYERAGGFEAVRDHVVDDVAFARAVKTSGGRVLFGDGFEIATCRMYRSPRELWSGFSKNIYEGMGENSVLFVLVVLLYVSAFVFPYGLLLAGALGGESLWIVVGGIGTGVNLLVRTSLAIRFRHTVGSVVLHPFAVAALVVLATNSMVWTYRNAIVWSGRTYPRRAARK